MFLNYSQYLLPKDPLRLRGV